LERTWRISYPTAARPGDHPLLDASVPGLGGAESRLELPASLGARGAPYASPLVPTAAYSRGLGTLAVMLLVALAVLCAVALVFASTGGGRLKRRNDPHVGAP